MPDTLIELQSVSFSSILSNINLKIKKKEILTIMGPNGSGKTSLIRIIAKIIPPTYGQVNYLNNLTIAYMPQTLSFDKTLPITVYDFLLLSHKKRPTNFYEVLDITQVDKLINKQIHQISTGELQLVLFTRCLLFNPDIFILDEPVSNLDINAKAFFYHLLETIHQTTNCSIVMASHDLHVVMRNSDRVICLNHTICCQGPPLEVQYTKEFLEMFTLYKHAHNDFPTL